MKIDDIPQDNAPIFGIRRLRMGIDGPGITTLVAFMGCPLRCKYCLNDFCHEPIFKGNGITSIDGVIFLSPTQLYDRVKMDNLYFQSTGGGICFGGGEPGLQSKFIKEFKKICDNNWTITIETTLNYDSEHIHRLIPIIDNWLIDIKDINPLIYKEYTGITNNHVLQNLEYLKNAGVIDRVTIKVPHIPNYNHSEDICNSISYLKRNKIEKFVEFHYLELNKNK